MDELDIRILEAVNALSSKSFVSPTKVNEILRFNEIELGNRLMLLKKSGHVDVFTSDYVSSNTLPNFISKVRITESGQRSLKEK